MHSKWVVEVSEDMVDLSDEVQADGTFLSILDLPDYEHSSLPAAFHGRDDSPYPDEPRVGRVKPLSFRQLVE